MTVSDTSLYQYGREAFILSSIRYEPIYRFHKPLCILIQLVRYGLPEVRGRVVLFWFRYTRDHANFESAVSNSYSHLKAFPKVKNLLFEIYSTNHDIRQARYYHNAQVSQMDLFCTMSAHIPDTPFVALGDGMLPIL